MSLIHLWGHLNDFSSHSGSKTELFYEIVNYNSYLVYLFRRKLFSNLILSQFIVAGWTISISVVYLPSTSVNCIINCNIVQENHSMTVDISVQKFYQFIKIIIHNTKNNKKKKKYLIETNRKNISKTMSVLENIYIEQMKTDWLLKIELIIILILTFFRWLHELQLYNQWLLRSEMFQEWLWS